MIKGINTKIVLSGATVLAAAALIIGGTFAFFSDTETSSDNTFVAGDIDLQIDNESYVTGPDGNLVASSETSWGLSDLTIEKFFNFTDLKPGDIGEDTISLHVTNNDAWLCAAARVTDNSDQDCTEPELDDDPSCTNPGLDQGDLAGAVNFAFWADDGDNVLEEDEEVGIFLEGPISALGGAGQIALADSGNNVWGDTGPLPSGSDRFIGKAWCFGTLAPNPQPEGDLDPLDNTGFTCDGSAVNNAAQTDQVVADLQFYAEQSRNNPDFSCDGDYSPVWPI